MAGSRESPPLESERPGVRRALVLSGGGARGAYEAGVLDYVLGQLPRRLGHVPRFDIYSGTSVGAVNACHMAAHADDPAAGAAALQSLWRELSFGNVYRFDLRAASSFLWALFGFASGRPVTETAGSRIHGLLDTSPLESLVVGRIPWRRLRRNLHRGLVDTLCVATTEIATGRSVVFVGNRKGDVPTWTRDEMHVAHPARLGPQHALASAAIPFLFPAVRLGETYYCDGGLRQQAPLAPALRLGANRVLVVGLRQRRFRPLDDRVSGQRLEQFRSAGFLLGKLLNSLLSDRLEYDLDHMRVINRMLREGLEVHEDGHRIGESVARERGLGFRIVEDCFVRPSQDIGAIASEHVRRLLRKPGRATMGRWIFRFLNRGAPQDEADLMSYLMFDGEYASELVELGRSDAAAMEEELLRFFSE
ncbi:MAG: patatin-like phospholipase family protein [Proteobacteria bacterium]|nr:patatin-like phospholipase family protein [Pseudomonadota bacterium]